MHQTTVIDTTSEFASVNGVRLHYVAAGRGAPIVFVHRFPEYSGAWAPRFAEFARDRRVLAQDLREYI